MNITSSTTTLTFTAPSLPDGVFTGTTVVMVTAVNRYGMGPASDPAIGRIYGQYLYRHSYVCIDAQVFTYVTEFAKRGLTHASNFSTLRLCKSACV